MIGASNSFPSQGGDISPASIISKISLLTIHFPKLQILWSRSPKHTAEIFRSLRNLPQNKNCDPDLQKASKIGKLDTAEISDGEDEDENFKKYMPIEFLKRVPGMDQTRVTEIARKGKQHGILTIVDLARASEETLCNIMTAKQAAELTEFLNRKVDFDFLQK